MKNTLLATLLILSFNAFGFPAHATTYGSQCDLIDEADFFELDNGEQDEHQVISKWTRLNSLQKRQIVHTSPETRDMLPHQALFHLIENSESGDLYYETGSFNGVEMQVFLYFPGGNTYGVVFKKGSDKPLAYLQDSDVVCAEDK